MVVRTRLRAVLLPLLLYAASGSVTTYFVENAVNGGRGLKAKEEYSLQMAKLGAELTDVTNQRNSLKRRVDMMSSENVDRDLLEEEVRTELGFVRSSDLVVFLPPSAPTKP